MVEINLLPQQYRKQSEPSAWRFAAMALPLVTAAVILGVEVATFTRVSDLQKQIDALNGEVTALTPAKQESDSLTTERNQLQQVTAVADQLRGAKSYWTNDIARFTTQLPSDGSVALKSMNVRALDSAALTSLQQGGVYVGKNVVREIDLSGEARSQQAVVNFLRAFENNPNFGVNFKGLASDATTGRYTFTASVGVVGGTGAAGSTPGSTPTTGSGTTGAAPASAVPASSPTNASTTGTPSIQGGGNVN